MQTIIERDDVRYKFGQISPAKYSEVLTKFGEVGRSGSLLHTSTVLATSSAKFIGVAIRSSEVLLEEKIVVEEVWARVFVKVRTYS